MESEHKELLEKCYQNLVESIADADRVVDVLTLCGTLSQSERYELGHNCSSNSEKVDLLLKILMSKDTDCFADFCTALEKTHPHLYSVLMNGIGPVDHTTGENMLIVFLYIDDKAQSKVTLAWKHPQLYYSVLWLEV